MILPIVRNPDGSLLVWLDSTDRLYHDASSGTDHPRPLATQEATQLDGALLLSTVFQRIQTLIGSVDLIMSTAEEDVADSDTRQTQIDAWSTTVTARAAAIRGTAAPTVAQIREELALACERDVRIAQEIDGFYSWRSVVDQLLELLAQCVAGLARLATRTAP